MNLYYCTANGPFGQFGDYILASTRAGAENAFRAEHGIYPTRVRLERKSK